MTEIKVSDQSSLASSEAEALVGETITGVSATEYGLVLKFATGAALEIKGHTYGDCALAVEFSRTVKP